MSGRSRNQASTNTACFQQVRARAPARVPISRRWLCQQARHEQHQWQRDVKDDTIGQHAEPPGRQGSWSRPLVPGAPRLPGDLQLCPRVCPYDRYAGNAGFTPAEKTSVGATGKLPVAPDWLGGQSSFWSGLNTSFRRKNSNRHSEAHLEPSQCPCRAPADLLQLSLRFQGRTFGAPGLTALAVSSEDGREQSRGMSGQGDPP